MKLKDLITEEEIKDFIKEHRITSIKSLKEWLENDLKDDSEDDNKDSHDNFSIGSIPNKKLVFKIKKIAISNNVENKLNKNDSQEFLNVIINLKTNSNNADFLTSLISLILSIAFFGGVDYFSEEEINEVKSICINKINEEMKLKTTTLTPEQIIDEEIAKLAKNEIAGCKLK